MVSPALTVRRIPRSGFRAGGGRVHGFALAVHHIGMKRVFDIGRRGRDCRTMRSLLVSFSVNSNSSAPEQYRIYSPSSQCLAMTVVTRLFG